MNKKTLLLIYSLLLISLSSLMISCANTTYDPPFEAPHCIGDQVKIYGEIDNRKFRVEFDGSNMNHSFTNSIFGSNGHLDVSDSKNSIKIEFKEFTANGETVPSKIYLNIPKVDLNVGNCDNDGFVSKYWKGKEKNDNHSSHEDDYHHEYDCDHEYDCNHEYDDNYNDSDDDSKLFGSFYMNLARTYPYCDNDSMEGYITGCVFGEEPESTSCQCLTTSTYPKTANLSIFMILSFALLFLSRKFLKN